MNASIRFLRTGAWLAGAAVLASCTSVGVGIAIPFPGGSIGVGVNNSGQVTGGVSVGVGGVSVGVGGAAQLPSGESRRKSEGAADAASAPSAPSAPSARSAPTTSGKT